LKTKGEKFAPWTIFLKKSEATAARLPHSKGLRKKGLFYD